MPYAKPRSKCTHGWYVGPGTMISSALFNTSTTCPRCDREERVRSRVAEQARRQAEQARRAGLTQQQRDREDTLKIIGAIFLTLLVALMVFGGLMLYHHLQTTSPY
jgi:hypothetical protein